MIDINEFYKKNGLVDVATVAAIFDKSERTLHNWIYSPKRAPVDFPRPVSVLGKHFYIQNQIDNFFQGITMSSMKKTQFLLETPRGVGRPKKIR
jgi:hypothetical protein